MKVCLNRQSNDRGSVLLVGMGVTLVLGLSLASYLMLARAQEVSIARSQAWNAAMACAEAGVEEALAQLNPSALLFTTNIDRGANGWTLEADGMYHAPRRKLRNGYYDVAISADTLPTIYSTGYVTVPILSATISRSVEVTTTNGSIFRGAMAAIKDVDFSGNGVTIDSFDSNDTAHSTNGLYYAPWRKANGDVASTEGIVNVQNANIMGKLYTGPDGSYSVGSSGSVGDLGWVLGGQKGLEPGHYRNDFNMDFPDVLPPYDVAVPPAGKTLAGTNYTWVLGSNNYLCATPGGAKLQSGDKVLVTGKARLYVTGNFIMSGDSTLIIAPGASLELYVGGDHASITSLNNAGNCSTFTYYGLPGNTSINVSGNSGFLGAIYAPSAALTLSGGGNNELDFQGACAVTSVTMNGHYNFHFDENLNRRGPTRGYQVTSWHEI